MSSVDDRIVNMQFNNKQFQAGAAESSKSLADLEKQIASTGSSSGFAGLGKQVDDVSSRFTALQVAGVTALATIVSSATSAAIGIGKDLLGSVTDTLFGAGKARAIALEQAKFQFQGLGLNIDKTMKSALDAVKGTAFGLQDAATLAAQFGGSGIKAGEEMTKALRGVSGIAAQTGRSYSEIGQVVAGIAGVGKVTTQDLMQFGVRGLNVAAAMGKEMGKTETEIRKMVSEGKIGFKQFALMMDKSFGKNATKSNETYTGSLANVRAAISRIGADIAAPRLESLKKIFNALTPVIDQVHEALKPFLESLGNIQLAGAERISKFLNSLDVTKILGPVASGIKNLFAPIVALFSALGDAWRQVFPASEGKDSSKVIYTIANAFELLTRPLLWLAEQIPKITPLFVGLFSAIKFGISVVSSLGSVLGGLVQKGMDIAGSILQGIVQGFDGNAIKMAVVSMATNIITWIKETLGIHSPAEETVPIGIAIIQGIIVGIQNAIKFLFTVIGTVSKAVADGFRDLFGGMDALDWTAFFNAILTGGLLLSLRSFTKTLKSFTVDLQGALGAITEPFEAVTNTLKTMQQQVKASMILKIAIAVGILAASLIALSFIDPEKLGYGLGALASMMAMLVGSLAVLQKVKPEGLFAIGASMVLISTAILVLTAAIAALGNMDLDTLEKGMGAFAVSLILLVAALQNLVGLGPGLPAAASAMLIMASAMTALTAALAILGNMDTDTLFQGIGAMAASLLILVAAVNTLSGIGPGIAAASAGIFIISTAMIVMAHAIQKLGEIELGTLAKGIGAMTYGLGLFTVALGVLALLGPTVAVAAASILIVSGAMLILARAIGILGRMDGGELAKGLGAIAVALGIFLLAALAASAPPVAAGLIVLGTSLALVGAGAALLGAGLLAAATAFTLFAAIGSVGIAAIIAGLTALMALMPTFAMQLATSFIVFIETIAKMAPRLREAFGVIIENILGTIQDAIPDIMDLASELITGFLSVVERYIPAAGKVLSAFIAEGLRVISKSVPDFVIAGVDIILGVIEGLGKRVNRIIAAGTELVTNFIKGLGQAGEDIATACLDTILTFLRELRSAVEFYLPQIEEEGRLLAGAIINGLTGGLAGNALELVRNAVRTLAEAIPEPIRKFLGIESPSKVARWWGEMIVEGLVRGIADNIKYAVGSVVALANAVIAAGDASIAAAQTAARKRQIAANKAAAKADVSDQLAKKAERAAKKDPDNKVLEKKAEEARKIAEKQAEAAQKAQDKADAAAEAVSKRQEFAKADDVGKGDILTERAEDLSARAARALAQANAEALAAKKLRGKEREAMLKQAKESAALAKKLAKQAKEADEQAQKYYARSVEERIKALNDEKKAREDQAAFDKATPAEQADILTKKAEDARKLAESQRAQVEALLKKAQKVAKTDAREAQRLLDQAEKLAAEADKNAEDAKKYADQAKQITNDTGSANTIQISKSVLEQAASVIDRYTESLQQAELAATAAPTEVQFIQHNYSPEALSAIEIYRQTGNLISLAEIKMGAK